MISPLVSEPEILSPQQKSINDLLSKGLKLKDIAKVLDISYDQVKTQARRIREKQEKKVLYDALDENDLLQLSGRQQQVMFLRRNGYKIKDAAKILGISASTARQYSFRAKTKKDKNKPSIKKYILTGEELQAVIQRSEQRNKPVPKDVISMAYKVLIENEKVTREEMLCVGITPGTYDWDAKKVAITERAKAFAILAERGPLTYIDKEEAEILPDVIEEYFVHKKDNLYKPKSDKAQEALENIYKERMEMLRLNDGIVLRHTTSGSHAKAYPVNIVPNMSPMKNKGKVIGVTKNGVIIRTESGIRTINTKEVFILRKSETFVISHIILKENDEVLFSNEKVIIKKFNEDVPVKIITR
jgi:DNA-binding CsgD family transcriptional regulator